MKQMNALAVIVVGVLSSFFVLEGAMPEPYRSIKMLPFELQHDWFSRENKVMLQKIIEEKRPRIIIEVGSWLGDSAIFMAKLMPEDGKLYAVDHWLGSFNHQKDHPVTPKLKTLYQQFLSNVIHSGLTHKIVPIKMSSLEAARMLAVEADLIYVDGSHLEDDVFRDIVAWHPMLAPGGIICGDDWNWVDGDDFPTRRGIKKAAQYLGKQIKVYGTFWHLQ